MSIVSTNIPYNSLILKQNLTALATTYPFINLQTIGTSVMGDSIYCVRLGTGAKEVFYSGGFHRK